MQVIFGQLKNMRVNQEVLRSLMSFIRRLQYRMDWGWRVNLGFLLIRLDAGMKAYDPADSEKKFVLFNPNFSDKFALHFAIGYPF